MMPIAGAQNVRDNTVKYSRNSDVLKKIHNVLPWACVFSEHFRARTHSRDTSLQTYS